MIEELLGQVKKRRPASDEAIRIAERFMRVRLPDEYVGFLRFSDGCEGFVGEEYVRLWSVEELQKRNPTYQIAKNTPGLLVIGSSGGGEAYGFDYRHASLPIVRVPFIGGWSDAQAIADTFTGFLRALNAGID